MREIDVKDITSAVKRLCIKANMTLPKSVACAVTDAKEKESSSIGREVLADLERNLSAAEKLSVPVCQDTGMAVVFLEVGQDIHITGGSLEDAVNEGVRDGYVGGRLRCSIVSDPLLRVNTGDNTPAIIHARIVSGDKIKVTVAPKGFGSENMSAVKMFTPAATKDDIIEFVVETVIKAGSNPCPPVIVGVGIGGDFEMSALLAKKALCRDIDVPNSDKVYMELENEMLLAVNATGIGPQGFGGDVTALKVNIEKYPTHIAGLPVAVNIGCHVTRHASEVL